MMLGRVAAALIFVATAPGAFAQQPLQPAPDPDDMIQPDRPDVTNGTHIVGVGLLQLEMGGIYTHAGQAQHAFGSPVTARLGVFDWLEARVGTDGLLISSAGGVQATGVGNLQVGAKLRLWADDGGMPVLSVLPAVNVPTASAEKGFGSGDADYTLAFLTGTDLGERSHIDINYGIGGIGAGGGQPHFLQHLLSASLSATAGPRWNPYAEVFWFSKQNPAGDPLTALDIGAIYTIGTRIGVDGGVQFGVGAASPAFAAFGGVSVIVGDVLGDHGVHERQKRASLRAAHRK